MIKKIDLSAKRVSVGAPIDITVYAPGPITVRVACFVSDPPPPRYTECAECATHKVVGAGEPFSLVADSTIWSDRRGRYELTITDSLGDTRVLQIDVDKGSGTSSLPMLER